MIAYAVRRIAGTILVLFAVSVLVFLIFFHTPGVDPARKMAGRQATEQQVEQIRKDFGLDRPLPVQYAAMMNRLLIKRDLITYSDRGQVLPRIYKAIPVTLYLVAGAAVIWVLLALAAGTLAAMYRGRFIDPLLMMIGLVGLAIPQYWLGAVINLFTQDRWHDALFSWLPELGYTPPSQDFGKWFLQMLFPWITLAIGMAGLYMRVLRADIIDVMSADFVRTARAKGLSENRVMFVHVLRNASIPIITNLMIQLPGLLVGLFLIERFFSVPGIGREVILAVERSDFPVIKAITVYVALATMLANLAADLLYKAVDPRVELK